MAERSKVDKFFGETFNHFINRFKILFIVIIGIWSIASCIVATQLSPLTEEESFLPDSYWAEKYLDVSLEGYNSGSQDFAIEMNFFWGVNGINKNNIDQWDSSDLGKIKWDKDFSENFAKNEN